MTLYHGSYLVVENPDIARAREHTDFGKGFYTTPIKEQAVRWSERFRMKRGQGVVSEYVFDDASAKETLSILEFETYSDAWLEFIIACRRGKDIGNYDLIVGGVANDKVFDTIELFLGGLVDEREAIKRLQYEKPNLQYCFRNQSVINRYLHFTASDGV
ncbi:MAG: DUF3990 domain-containing protein [Candidatus Accumulibacter sp.]|nr:DUF3990 domain-containing protein [Accumulibacter sp.]